MSISKKQEDVVREDTDIAHEDADITIEEGVEEQSQAQKIKKLTEKLKQCEQERSDYLAGWQRAKADFINARRKDEERQKEFLQYAEVSLMKELLPLLDSFDSAFQASVAHSKESDQWRKGVESIAQQLLHVLRQRGVERITAKGERFDPALHEAVAVTPVTTPTEDHVVIQEEQAGYRWGALVLRPAKVRIGKLNKNPPETLREEEKKDT